MIVKASIENFKSFEGRTELTMIASSKIDSYKDHTSNIDGVSLLKHGVIYGANASGKTNLVDFFHFFKTCVQSGFPINTSNMFCKNKEGNKWLESSFEIQMTVGNKFYAYGFSAVLYRRTITSEWLYELNSDGSYRRLFEREKAKKPVLDSSVALSEEEKTKFEIYADDFSGNENILFLTEMNRGKKYSSKSNIIFFKKVYDWIKNNITVIMPNTPLIDLEYYNEKSLEKISKLIKTFDTGISEVKIEEITLEELGSMLPMGIFESVKRHIKKRIDEGGSAHLKITMRSDRQLFNIESYNGSEPRITTIRLRHGNSFYDFDFEDESDGTRRLFDLIGILLNDSDDRIYIVDELERSLHPKLTERFLELFAEMNKERRIQLLFTTHESSIMDLEMFRRDEIWFAEREQDNSSRLYSLDRFNDRYDNELGKAYLEGRYGAVPVFPQLLDVGEEE